MPIDPASIPQHVVDAALYEIENCPSDAALARDMPAAIAAALDALMDDEPVAVPDPDHNVREDLMLDVRPSDVLAAVLAREET